MAQHRERCGASCARDRPRMIGAPEQPGAPPALSRRTSLRHTSEPGRSSSARPGAFAGGLRVRRHAARLDRDPLGALDGLHRQGARTARHRRTGDARRSLRPASDALALDGTLSPDHYWWLAYAWENLYPSCAECVSFKGARFPVRGARGGRNDRGGAPRRAGAPPRAAPRRPRAASRLRRGRLGREPDRRGPRHDRDPRPQPRAAARLPARGTRRGARRMGVRRGRRDREKGASTRSPSTTCSTVRGRSRHFAASSSTRGCSVGERSSTRRSRQRPKGPRPSPRLPGTSRPSRLPTGTASRDRSTRPSARRTPTRSRATRTPARTTSAARDGSSGSRCGTSRCSATSTCGRRRSRRRPRPPRG